MKTRLTKILSVFLAASLLFSSLVFSVSAATDFTMDNFDKGYVTIVFDDGKMPVTSEAAAIFEEFDMPMSAAVPAKLVEYDNELYNTLMKIQDNGGEILSHGYNHIPIVDTTNADYANKTNNAATYIDTSSETATEDMEYELGESWRKLNNLGFNVNGMIQVGCGGAEGTADYEAVEAVARKYYKYSDGSGVAPQYAITRRSASWDTMENLKKRIDTAAANKTWVVLYVHSFAEISSDAGTTDGSALREVLQYIKDKNGTVEVVTYNGMYNAFGNYTGPAVPTADALASLDAFETKDYYVMSTGHDSTGTAGDGRSESTPAATVADAIAAAKADGLSKGDTANVYILQDADGDTAVNATAADSGYYKHNMTAWTDTGSAVDSWDFNLVVKSPEGETNFLASSHYIGMQSNIYIGGPTKFENVILLQTNNYSNSPLVANGNNVEFGASSNFSVMNASGKTNTFKRYNPGASFFPITLSETAGATYSKDVNLVINSAYKYTSVNSGRSYRNGIFLASHGARTTVFEEDVNIVVDNENTIMQFTYGGGNASAKATFNKTLNINIKSAAQVDIGTLGVSNTEGAIGSISVGKGLQIIYPSSAVFENVIETLEAKGITKYWILENGSTNKDLLTFAIDAHGDVIPGTYKVADGNTIKAEGVNGTYTSSNGRLVIEKPGKYTITTSKTYDYYVKSMGTTALNAGEYDTTDGAINGSGTKEDPAATVMDVIKIANDAGLGKGDVANVYIIQRDDWNEYDGSLIGKNSDGTYSVPYHNMTAWAHALERADNKTPEAHEWTMVIKGDKTSAADNGRIYLTYSDRLGSNHSLALGGPTVFENVTLTMMRSSRDRAVFLNDNDATFSNTTTYGYINNSYHTTSMTAWDCTVLTSATASLPNSLIAEGVNATQTGMTVNYNNSYTGDIYIPSTSSGSYKNFTFSGDININLDNSVATPGLVWYVKGSNTSIGLRNVNIHIRAGKLSNSIETFGSSSTLTANAVQAIVEDGASITGLDTTLSTIGITNYYVINNTGEIGDIEFSKDANGDVIAGKYVINSDINAIAANEDGVVVAISKDGMLDLTGKPGVYTVRYADAYDNDGSTITVYEAVKIDLATIQHNEIDGKVFIGWAFADGTYPEQVAEYKNGDVLYAMYQDYTDVGFVTEEVQVRDDGNDGDPSLRFIHTINKKALPNITERGTLVLPLSKSYGYDMYLNEPIVTNYTATKEVAEFNVATTGATPTNVSGTNILEETEDTLKYTICITGITQDNYTTSYAVRAYVKYADYNGVGYILYANQEVSSLYKAAAEATEPTDNEKAIVEYVEGERVANYWLKNGLTADGKITSTTTAQYVDAGCGCFGTEECDHKLFTLNDGKLYVRDVTLDTGLGIEETQIGFITDTHFNNINQMDIDENSVALSSYRGRPESWRKHQQQYFTHGINEFVSMFDKTVNGGDVMDYLSWGALFSSDRIFTKQSVQNRNVKKFVSNGLDGWNLQDVISGSMSMVLGNHDPKQLSSPVDKTLDESRTLEQRYAMVDPYWTNELYYDSEIMLNSNGEANIMMIYLDNSQGKYWESQIAPLTRDLAYAKEQGIPALIFQHIPMLSMNPNETEWKYLDGFYNYNKIVPQDNSYYDIVDGKYTIKEGYIGAGSTVNVIDMTSNTGYMGNKNSDEATMTVYNLIRQNADVVKGVFDGHIHGHTKSEIIGIDENGDANGLIIPQYTGYLASQRGVMRITIK